MKTRGVKAALLCTLLCMPGVASAGTDSGATLWQHQFDSGIWSPLTLADGVLYFGCDDGNVYALDPATQKVIWKFASKGRVRSSSGVGEGIVTFASDDGFLYALDVATGEMRWQLDIGSGKMERRLPAEGPPYEYDYKHSAPVHSAGIVYVGSADGHLYAIDEKTGEERWRFATEGKVRSTPAIAGGRVYFGSWDFNLYAVNAETGKEAWRFSCKGAVQGSPALGAGKVFVGSRAAKLVAVDASSGEPVWEYPHKDGSWVESSPVFHDGVVYVGSSDALKLFAFDADSGELAWAFKTSGWSWGDPVVANGAVYIGAISAYPYYMPGVELVPGFHSVDAATGEVKWSAPSGSIDGYVTGGVFSSPVVLDGVVYVAGIDGTLTAIKE